MHQPNGKIFLASERGHMETTEARSYYTFNYKTYQNEHKQAFGRLQVLNDETLGGGEQASFSVEENMTVLILPVVGAVNYSDDMGHVSSAEAGQLLSYTLPKGSSFTIINPYPENLINYLQFCIRHDEISPNKKPAIRSFNLDRNKNQWLPLYTSSDCRFYIAKLEGRTELAYQTKADCQHFLFVVEGAFEAENILLETRDGLALTGVDKIEMEALSNDAIMVMIALL